MNEAPCIILRIPFEGEDEKLFCVFDGRVVFYI